MQTSLTGAELVQLVTVVFSFLGVIASTVGAVMIARSTATMKLLEKNTNSIKDALVASVGKQRFAEGVKHEQEKQQTKDKSNE